MSNASQAAAIRALQAQLALRNPAVRIDGIVGPTTRSTLAAAPPQAKAAIESMLAVNTNFKLDQLTAAPTRSARGAISESQLLAMIAEERRVNPLARYLTWLPDREIVKFARIESNLVPTARNTYYYGLFAMGQPAWVDAKQVNPAVGSFSSGWSNPRENLRAAMSYWGRMIRDGRNPRLGRVAIDTPEKLYASHQQGHAGFTNLVRSGKSLDAIRNKRTGLSLVDNQSADSLIVVARAVGQVRSA